MFKPYQSKPTTRMGAVINESGMLQKVSDKEATYSYQEAGEYVEFKAYEPPQVGDFIVRLTEEDTYHVSRAVFHERNVVPE